MAEAASPPWIGPYGRRELTRDFGASALDRVQMHWACGGCGTRVDDPTFYTIGTTDYGEVAQLHLASRVGLSLAEQTAFASEVTDCCARAPVLRAADYHAYQSDPDRDLVLRWLPTAEAPELLFWDFATTYTPTTSALDAHYDAERFRREGLLRRAAGRLEAESLDAALADIEACAGECDAYWEIVAFVKPLAEGGQVELARSIADAFIHRHLDDDKEPYPAHVARARALLAALPQP